jgi:cytochrome c-type biogenesis protein CcmH
MTWRTMLRRPGVLIPVGLVLLVGVVWMVTALSTAQPQSLDARTREVARQIQCPVCNGESVADSSSQKAAEMRAVIRQQLAEGQSEQQVLDYFKRVYGDEILESPPAQGFTTLIWIMPLLMVLAGIVAVVALGRAWQRSTRIKGAVVAAGDDLDADETALSADERQALTSLLRRELAADEGLPFHGKEIG